MYGFVSDDGVNNWDYLGLVGSAGIDWDWRRYQRENSEKANREFAQSEIRYWRAKGYHFAADLFTHFLKNTSNDYQPTKANINEVKKHGKEKICKTISEYACDKRPAGSSLWDIEMKPKSDDDSNIRWYYIGDNKNMLLAYGGARFSATGCVQHGKDATFAVTLKDRYEWVKDDEFLDPLKQAASSTISRAYMAAVILESKFGYSTFEHEIQFELKCNVTCN